MDKKKWIDGMMGLVIGDACGVPVEFKSREELKENPVVDMREFGSHHQPRGTWSDDSSMAFATLASLHNGYDLKDIAEQFLRWDREEIYTPFGEVFDIGMTCNQAIRRFQLSGDPYTCGSLGEYDNGNGSLMRILPICLYAFDLVKKGSISEENAIEMVHEVSALTHGNLRSMMACGLYYFCTMTIIENRDGLSLRECLQKGFDKGFEFYRNDPMNLAEVEKYGRLVNMTEFKDAKENTIKSSGYVLDAFEAAIWCLINTKDYAECILKAVNLGDDTDTVGAIAGGLAGLYYGYDTIPKEWKQCIIQKDWILELCDLEKSKSKTYEGPVVDNHSHVMPGIDDGSKSMRMTLEMLELEEKEGVTDLFLTSHGDYVCERPEEYEEIFQEVLKKRKECGINVNLYKGCEIFGELTTWNFDQEHDEMIPVIESLKDHSYPTYNNTEYALIEFNIDVRPEEALYITKRIQGEGYVPVLAHAERYPMLINEHFVEVLVKYGCLVQINAYSLVEEKTEMFKKNARYLLGKGLVHFLGSDAHRSEHRPPRMKSGVQYVWETCAEDYAKDIIYRNSYKYLLGNLINLIKEIK